MSISAKFDVWITQPFQKSKSADWSELAFPIKKIGFIYLLFKWLMDSNFPNYDISVFNRRFPPWNIATDFCAIEPQRFGKLFKNLCQVETVDCWFIQKQR